VWRWRFGGLWDGAAFWCADGGGRWRAGRKTLKTPVRVFRGLGLGELGNSRRGIYSRGGGGVGGGVGVRWARGTGWRGKSRGARAWVRMGMEFPSFLSGEGKWIRVTPCRAAVLWETGNRSGARWGAPACAAHCRGWWLGSDSPRERCRAGALDSGWTRNKQTNKCVLFRVQARPLLFSLGRGL
jgi:hypothetical protein